MERRKKVTLIAGGAVVLCAALGLIIFLTVVKEQPDEPAAPPLTSARAEQLGADISSGDTTRVRQALAVPEGAKLDPAAPGALAKLKIQLDTASFRPIDAQTATVSGTVSEADGPSQPARFTLVLADGQWRLVSAGPPS
ncbi:MAG TPA: hypothetical protein VFC19_39175 [Candidatus Limnocylindrales bacterium]|nr:hypothetical protein [Candidatus Limnocylindrales bacterium]